MTVLFSTEPLGIDSLNVKKQFILSKPFQTSISLTFTKWHFVCKTPEDTYSKSVSRAAIYRRMPGGRRRQDGGETPPKHEGRE